VSTGYGVEMWCFGTPMPGRFARGVMVVAQALYNRTRTPRGTLRGPSARAGTYGLDLAGYVGAVGYPTAARAIPRLLAGEFLKDDRVADVAISASIVTDTAGLTSITLDANVTLSETGESFTLTLGVDDTDVSVLGVTQ
jgi:hypothetical protein